MTWKQRFERALKTGTFNEDDWETSASLTDCATGDKLYSMHYNMSHSSDSLNQIIWKLDRGLAHMGLSFTEHVGHSVMMPEDRELYGTDAEYREACLWIVNKTQKIYDHIQNKELTQDLINALGLKATPVISA